MKENDELVVIYQPADIVAANMIKGILEDAGVEVLVRSLQIPMYDDIMKAGLGCWGEILVRKGQAGRAKKIIQRYLKAIKSRKPREERDTK